MYDVSPTTSSVGIRTRSNARRLACHLAVRGDDRALAVAIAEAAVVVREQVGGQLPRDELARSRRQHALLVAAVDPLLEGDVGAVATGVLCGGESRRAAGAGSPDRAGRAARRDPARPPPPRRRSRPPNEWPSQAAGPGGADSSTSATCCSRFQGGSQGESPWPRRSSATTWKRSDRRSASCSKCRPWLVTPWRQTSGGRLASPHS